MLTSTAGSERGFTLLELLVTLAIVALVTAFAAPSIASRLLESPVARTARLVRGLAEEGRAAAATAGQPMALVWSPAERAFTLTAAPEPREGPYALPPRGTPGSARVVGVPPDVRVETRGLAPVQGGRWSEGEAAGLLLLPLGGSTGGTVVLRSGAEQASVSVDPLTGYASYGGAP